MALNNEKESIVTVNNVSKRFIKSLDLAGKIAQRFGADIREDVVHAVDRVSLNIQDGEVVSSGQPILLIAPTKEQVWEALRAMYFIGEKKDLKVIKRFLTPNSQLSRRVQEQAFFSINSIKSKIAY